MSRYASPSGSLIRDFGTLSIPGDFHVTDTFAGHLASGRPPGLDIGNARCGAPIYAIGDGKVSLAGFLATAKVVRINHGNGDESGYAHLATITVKLGQNVKRGAQVGTLGSTGATACHLHLGLKRNGVEIDPWPELQNEDEMDPSFSPKPNRTVTVAKGARHRTAPTTADPANIAIASDPGGPLGFPLMGTVVGQALSGNSIWYAYWRPETLKVYYLHTSTCGPETPWETVAVPGDCAAEVKAATDPLTKAVNDANAKLLQVHNLTA